MTKKLLFLTAGIGIGVASMAAPLTPEQALTRLHGENLRIKSLNVARTSGAVPAYTYRNSEGVAAAYIFNDKEKGYMILSADDLAYPVLGYSDSGKVDPDNMPEAMKWWLSEYARQIEWASENGRPASRTINSVSSEWEAINPLVSTKWDQDAPYNNECPTPRNSTQKTYSGCVAVSMAQVMNYFKYPEVGQGRIQYTGTKLGRTLALNFANQKFDWDNMLDVYTSGNYDDAQASAVAYLMKACGYSVQMNYGLDASGASGSAISSSAIQYFKYDANTRDIKRMVYSSSDWANEIYNNLKNIGPVIINGQSPLDGGHSFVCDGYDGEGYFHINWGWSGISDGYYALDALNPDAQGIGGYAGGFNFTQNAIIGMQPPTGEPESKIPGNLLQYGASTGSVSGRVLTMGATDYSPTGWFTNGGNAVRVSIGVNIIPDKDTEASQIVGGRLGNFEVVTLDASSYYPADRVKATFTLPTLPDGEYKVVLSTKDLDMSDSQWIPVEVPWGYPNYVNLRVENGVYSVTDVPVSHLTISDVNLDTDLYYGKNFRMTAKVTNTSDVELTQGFSPCLYNGENMIFTGESILIAVDPNQTKEVEWISKFIALQGAPTITSPTSFTLAVYNPQTNQKCGDFGEVIMNPAPGKTTVSMRGYSILNAEMSSVEFEGHTYPSVFMVDDPSDFTMRVLYRVTNGYFDGQWTIGLARRVGNNNVPINDEIYSENPFVSASTENREMLVPVDFSDAEPGQLYVLTIKYTSNQQVVDAGFVYFMTGTVGIDSVEVEDSEVAVKYYNLQGNRIASPKKGDIVIVRQGDKTCKKMIK